MSAEQEAEDFEVRLSAKALATYLDIEQEKTLGALDKKLELLGAFPYLGHAYDPVYPAARPPFPLYVTYAGDYGIYYEVSEAQRTVAIDFIIDQRRDPENRFAGDSEQRGL